MTIKTSVKNLTASPRMKALAAVLLIVSALAASLLAPTQADASAFPGVNGRIVFSSDRTTGTGVNNPEGDLEIFSMNSDGAGLKQLTTNNSSDLTPSYSADGKKIAFASQRTGNFDVFVMNADGTAQKNLTKNPAREVSPSFSPNGKKVAFQRDITANNIDIFVMNADGTQQTVLTSDPQRDEDPTFSPTGNKIAFVSDRGNRGSNVFVMNADGTGQTNLTNNLDIGDEDPVFSPDGNKIAFASNRSGQGDPNDFDVFVMNVDGSGPQALTFSRATDEGPALSPDNKKLAYVSTRDGGDRDVFVMDLATGESNQTNVTPNDRTDATPDWQPTAKTFTVTSPSDLGNDGVCDSKCALREAINASNATPGSLQNTIKFNIFGSAVQTITPFSALPEITRPVIIDGYTQAGASPNTLATGDNAVLKIELNGTNVPGADGLAITGTSGNSVIKGLVINRFGTGISVSGDTVGNRIEGNFIGTDPTGTIDRGNDFDAVAVFDGPSGNTIGGSTPVARNVLSGNDDTGIFMRGANGNTIQGNYVGTDKSGTKALGNTDDGVAVLDSFGTTVGGTAAGAGNLISGNPIVGLDMVNSNGAKVLGNRVGTTANGTGSLGNTDVGVFVSGSNNLIGDGTAAGSNTVAFNGEHGVQLSSGTGNTVSRNSIFSNTDLGIDLFGGFEDANGATANDPGDIDSGANGLQNFPVITSAKKTSTGTTIVGTLGSAREVTYKIQFFSNPSGNEGKKFLGEKSVTTNGSGNASFTFSTPTAVAAGQTITATATGPEGTSEFSAPRTVTLSTGSDLAPDTAKISGPSGVTKSPTAHFKFASPDPDATFECSLDGGAYYECSSPENINRLSSGEHTFEVRAVDADGNADASPATWRWEVDRKK